MRPSKKNILISKRTSVLFLLSFLHSIALLFATYVLLDQNLTYGDERFLIKWSTILKKVVLGIDNKPPQSDFLFINTCYDNMLIDKLDEDGFTIGNQVITDRDKLAELFSHINKHPKSYKYILCDIFFENESPSDDMLRSELSQAKNIIVPFNFTPDEGIKIPVFDVNKGLSEYNVISGSFLKYRLVRNDSLASIPLKMYCDLTGYVFTKQNIFSYLNGKLSFNNTLIDFRLRYYDILKSVNPHAYPMINLGEFLSLPDSIVYESFKDRIIVIGDLLGNDIHQTVIGDMPGALILLNAYLTLANQENIIGLPLILILLTGYFIISLDIFSSRSISDRKLSRKYSNKRFWKFLLKLLGYVVYLAFISILIYFLYNIHINILIIAVYLKSLDSFLKYLRKTPQIEVNQGFNKIVEKYRIHIYKILTE